MTRSAAGLAIGALPSAASVHCSSRVWRARSLTANSARAASAVGGASEKPFSASVITTLRAFHEVDPTGCPFDYRIPRAIAHAAGRVTAGTVDPQGFHDEHRHLGLEEALARLRALAPTDERDLIVCHGDYCFPNVLLEGDRVVGYVDPGEAGSPSAGGAWPWRPGAQPGTSVPATSTVPRCIRRRVGHRPPGFYRLLYDLEA